MLSLLYNDNTEPVLVCINCYIKYVCSFFKHEFDIFNKTEANVSELLENSEEMLPSY